MDRECPPPRDNRPARVVATHTTASNGNPPRRVRATPPRRVTATHHGE
ncbi:hypothetical protein L842_3354 [Mycobacterium intracellulare MIN_052511_1280]|nr:hypothetical protein L842_3354 [Mycobacterium intracellulare MIN_052511_1280]